MPDNHYFLLKTCGGDRINQFLSVLGPALVIAGIQNAVPIWNDFFFPLVLITSDRLKTLPQGLTVFMGEYNTDWGVLFAGLTLAALRP